MTIDVWLRQTELQLKAAGIGTPRLDSLVLLEDFLNTDRARLLAYSDMELTPEQLAGLERLIARRAEHEPLAYIRGVTEFYGRRFAVNRHVLVPRPETEIMIDLLKQMDLKMPVRVADIGCGSGALAISAKLELPEADVAAIDIDPECLNITRKNAKDLGANIHVLRGDLAEPLPASSNLQLVLLCNLPYVPDNYEINRAAGYEPELALFGGDDGLELYRQLFKQLKKRRLRPDYILTESLPFQHSELLHLASGYHYKQVRSDGLIQSFASIN